MECLAVFARSQWGSELWICFPLSPAQIQLPLRNQTVSIAGVLSLTRAEQPCRCMQHTAHEGGDVPALSSEQLLQHSSSCRGVQRAQSHCCAVCCAGVLHQGAVPRRSCCPCLEELWESGAPLRQRGWMRE